MKGKLKPDRGEGLRSSSDVQNGADGQQMHGQIRMMEDLKMYVHEKG